MSQGRFSTPPLAPEDDWFAEPEEPPRPEEPREPDTTPPPPRHGAPRSREVRVVIGALLLVALLLVGGVLVARALTGSEGGGETTTSSAPTTTTTTSVPETTTATTTTSTTPTTTVPITLPEETVRPGEESDAVSQVQAALVELGYSTGGIDGKFGPATEQAVREFQESSGLEVDGVVGAATLAALSTALDST